MIRCFAYTAFEIIQLPNMQRDGFINHNEIFGRKFVFVIILFIQIIVTKNMLNDQPAIKAYMPYFGTAKYTKPIFIDELKRLVLKMKTCSPRPFNIPENVT